MESLEHTYAYLQPLKILDDDDEGLSEDVDLNDSTDSPALTPVKEEVEPRDLRSYFKGKLLFDEPDGPPVIWVQPARDDFAVVIRKKPRKAAKKNLERTVPCRSCDRKFVAVRHMKIHAATHSRKRIKNYYCRVCRRKFSNAGALGNHMRSHKKKKSSRAGRK